MTTTVSSPKQARTIEQEPGQECLVGRSRIAVRRVRVGCEGFTWEFYVTTNDVWFEGCENCDQDSGVKAHYGHIFNGVCFQCAGAGVKRIAGSEIGMQRLIRQRVSSRLGRLNAAQRAAERLIADAETWSAQHPNVASDLARVRVEGSPSNLLTGLALSVTRAPLTVRQEAAAVSLLRERAWKEAHATLERPTFVTVGNVGETLTFTGVVTVAHYVASERFDRSPVMLIVVEMNVDGTLARLKMNTSAAWSFNVAKGDEVTLRAKVVEHKQDGTFGPQTIVKGPKRV